MIFRHNMVAKTLLKMMTSAGYNVNYEERAVYPGAGKGGPDFKVYDFRNYHTGRDTFVEFAVVNPASSSVAANARSQPLFAASKREDSKTAKYANLARMNGHNLHAVAIECTGAQGRGLQDLIKKCSRHFHECGQALVSPANRISIGRHALSGRCGLKELLSL